MRPVCKTGQVDKVVGWAFAYHVVLPGVSFCHAFRESVSKRPDNKKGSSAAVRQQAAANKLRFNDLLHPL